MTPADRPRTSTPVLLAVAALAAATLLLEGALLRLLAVAQFYHFAFLVVSLALLGFGASGTMLTLSVRLRSLPLSRLLAGSGIAFFISAGVAYGVVNLLPFDSYSIAWERRQLLYFALYYLALSLPFFCSGLGIGGALAGSHGTSHLIYASNLLGSALGAALSLLAMALAGVPGTILLASLIGLTPALRSGRRQLVTGLLAIGLLAFAALATVNQKARAPLGMTVSPYKGLAYAMQFPGSSLRFGAWNAVSRADVVADAGTRQLPGLSYTYLGTVPPQLGLSLDAGAVQPVTLTTAEHFEAAGYLPEAVAFALRPPGKVLILQPGGGLGVLQALAAGSQRTTSELLTAVVDNGLVPEAVASTASDWNVYSHPQVQTVTAPSRAFLDGDEGRYAMVFMPLTDAYRPVTSGAYSLAETYDLTVEAFRAALARLQPDGILTMTRWVQSPPSEEIRLLATLVAALGETGVSEPAEALVAYRGIQTITVLARPAGWTTDELDRMREFLEARRYDLVWAPDIRLDEANRFNRQPEPLAYLAIRELLTGDDPDGFLATYPFAVTPATDNQPFFFHFFRWQQTPEILATLGQTWQPFGGSGYLILLALLALVVALSALLILAPLIALPFEPGSGSRVTGMRALAYFALLGIAFLFVEIPLIQRWILLLGHPTYAFAAVIVTLLVGSGVGSMLTRSTRLPRRTAFATLVALALLTPLLIDRLSPFLLGVPLLARGIMAGLSLTPLAVLMGMPFPLGLAWLEEMAPRLIPWAWAVNGCASVIASVLAAILALGYGFSTVLFLGAAAYGLAWLVLFAPTITTYVDRSRLSAP